jgi:hypothetical protein
MEYGDGWDGGRGYGDRGRGRAWGRSFRGRGRGYGAQPVGYYDNGEYDAPPASRGKYASPPMVNIILNRFVYFSPVKDFAVCYLNYTMLPLKSSHIRKLLNLIRQLLLLL